MTIPCGDPDAMPEWLVALADKHADGAAPHGGQRANGHGPGGGRPSNPSAYAWAALLAEVQGVSQAPQGTRNNRLNVAAFNLGQLVGAGLLGETKVASALLRAAVQSGLSRQEARRTICSGLDAGRRKPRAFVCQPHLTDMGNAQRLLRLRGGVIRHVAPWRTWLCYDGQRWRVDDTAQIDAHAKTAVRCMHAEASDELDADQRGAISAWARRSENASRVAAMVTLARSEPGVAIPPGALDRSVHLLNVANGTIDLRTGALRPHDPNDLLTKLGPVRFDASAQCPLWQAFLSEIFASDTALVEFVQRFLGSCLGGEVRDHALVFMHGTGRNGKSTLVNVVLGILGDYAMSAPHDFLLAKQGESHPTALADLFGKRFVATIEVDEGRRLAESLVKQLTGGDRIRARRMREDFWEFAPTHKVVLVANHKPVVRGTDHAIWSRIKLVPFEVRIENPDKLLTTKLLAEASGILNWLLDGYRAWNADGLGEPPAIAKATQAYRDEQDLLATFISARCEHVVGAKTSFAAMYIAYQAWCADTGERPATERLFNMRMRERDYLDSRNAPNGAWAWQGIALRGRAEALKNAEADPPISPS